MPPQLHVDACVAEMERALAVEETRAKGDGVECGVCMEVVLDKARAADRRFGILSHCDHAFCLACIRGWRATGAAATDSTRACPLCRTLSHYVVPSACVGQRGRGRVGAHGAVAGTGSRAPRKSRR